MIYSHFIGRVGAKDAQVINGHNGSFMAVDVAVDTYSKGVEKTMWIRVRSNRPNLVSLAKYLTRGKLLLIEGALGEPTVWTDKNGVNHAQLSINADVIRFVSSGKKKDTTETVTEVKANAKPIEEGPIYVPDPSEEDLPF